MPEKRRLLSTVEVSLSLVLACVAVTTMLVAWRRPSAPPEIIPQLERRFGPRVASEGPEEWFLRDFFSDERGGVFLDVGAGPAREGSNTYVLERDLGWTGLAIDAQADYAPDYRTYRPGTRFVSAYVSDRDGQQEELWVLPHRPQSSSRDVAFARFYSKGDEPIRRAFTSVTVDTLLRKHGLARIDYMNLDIELSEPQALAGFSIEQYCPRLISVEAHVPTRQAILDYFSGHSYVLVGRYLRDDPINLWFKPRGGPGHGCLPLPKRPNEDAPTP
jgi:hypothetical protein